MKQSFEQYRLARTAACAVLLANAALSQAAPPQPTIVLRERVVLSHANVVLGDVADLSGADAAWLERLAALPIGPAPLPGTAVTLERAALEAWLGRSLRHDGVHASWQGAATARLERPAPSLAVKAGDSVRLVSRLGSVAVEVAALALQGGHAGQRIRVRSSLADAPLVATVMRSGEVEVLP